MEALYELFQTVKEIWSRIKEFVQSFSRSIGEIESEKRYRSTWHVCWDNHRRSQVNMNKPLFAVRKII